jgi:hypothetical protein
LLAGLQARTENAANISRRNASSCVNKQFGIKMSFVWKYESDDGFRPYRPREAAMLDAAYAKLADDGEHVLQHPNKRWQFDLKSMTQTNVESGTKRRITREPTKLLPVPAPPSTSSMMRFLQFGFSGTFSQYVARALVSAACSILLIRSRGEGLIIEDSSHDDLPQGWRIVSVDGVSIVHMQMWEVRKCFPVAPVDSVVALCLEHHLMGTSEIHIPMWREAKRVASLSATPAQQQQQHQQQHQQHQQQLQQLQQLLLHQQQQMQKDLEQLKPPIPPRVYKTVPKPFFSESSLQQSQSSSISSRTANHARDEILAQAWSMLQSPQKALPCPMFLLRIQPSATLLTLSQLLDDESSQRPGVLPLLPLQKPGDSRLPVAPEACSPRAPPFRLPAAPSAASTENTTGEGMSVKQLADFLSPQVVPVSVCFSLLFRVNTLFSRQVRVPFNDLIIVRSDILMQACAVLLAIARVLYGQLLRFHRYTHIIKMQPYGENLKSNHLDILHDQLTEVLLAHTSHDT